MAKLVTGGMGFIGRHLVRRLASQGEEVRVIDIATDTTFVGQLILKYPNVRLFKTDVAALNPYQWERLLEGVSTVYHLSGLLGTSELYSRVIEAERVNVLGTLHLLEAMNRNHARRIVFTSKPNMWKHNVYTITKENSERYLEMYRAIYGMEVTILRPFNVYGPEEKVDQYRKAVPYFIIAALKNEPIEIFGSGEQTMDLIYVEDCVDAFIAASQQKAIGEVLEVGSGQETSVNTLAKLIIRLANSKSEIKHLPMRKGETPDSRIRADITNMEKVCQFTAKTNLAKGLCKTIGHYRENLNDYKVYKFTEAELV